MPRWCRSPAANPCSIRSFVNSWTNSSNGKYIYLCTNAILLNEKLEAGWFKPSKYLSFSVHMDGRRDEHDFAVCREGTYDKAIVGIQKAVDMGFRVTTNTTLFEGTDPNAVREFFDQMMDVGVEGMMVSPGYAYDKAGPDELPPP